MTAPLSLAEIERRIAVHARYSDREVDARQYALLSQLRDAILLLREAAPHLEEHHNCARLAVMFGPDEMCEINAALAARLDALRARIEEASR